MRSTILTTFAAIGLMALSIGLTGCHSTGGRSTGQAMNDYMTGRDVKKALAKSPVYKFKEVRPIVYNGSVQLTGFVNSDQQRTEAAQIASRVQGVHEVINDIIVKPTPVGRATIREGRAQELQNPNTTTNAPAGSTSTPPPNQPGS